jgi:hypothetical protein
MKSPRLILTITAMVGLAAGAVLGFGVSRWVGPRYQFLTGSDGMAVWRCDRWTGRADWGHVQSRRVVWWESAAP